MGRGIAPFILNLGSGFYLPGKNPVPTELEIWWPLEPAWTFWRREKSLASTGIRTPDPPDRLFTFVTVTVDVG